MTPEHLELFSSAYLYREFGSELAEFTGSPEEAELLERLRHWSQRDMQNEVTAQGAFVDRFFKQLWGYTAAGEGERDHGYTAWPQYPIARAGSGGGIGFADLALGWFGLQTLPQVPQVLCEFKDIRSGLDTPQRRKGDTRTPVKQCATYLHEVKASLHGNEPVQPHWGIVTDMNEFRLYRRLEMPGAYQRFVIKPRRGDNTPSLLADNPESSFQRLVFSRLFREDRLISKAGDPLIIRDLQQQLVRERELEDEFYQDYRAYRERLIELLIENNRDFAGTPGRLVRLAQTILDRSIFVLFCEDMGRRLSFPSRLLTNYLEQFSTAPFYSHDGEEIWTALRQLFQAMDLGGVFQQHTINRFNGGLFARDVELDGLRIPNAAFCAQNQASGVEQLQAHPRTLLYLAATYNFGGDLEGKRITLYTLGRIFEQSITELEVLEAEADGRPSLTKITKRKRDGVYYTPEWVVRTIVEETLGSRLTDLRREAGLSDDELVTMPSRGSVAYGARLIALDNYKEILHRLTVVDPACGSGAFLIHALEYLLQERRRLALLREQLTGGAELFEQEEQIRDILSQNVYGIDINPASVEIARLALWLHTARADRPLCDLNHNVRAGNSLVTSEDLDRWDAQLLIGGTEMQRERINAFSWRQAFPEVAEHDGFDCLVGNPPYVKLQNFAKVQPDIAAFLRTATDIDGGVVYASTQAGNFDLFLPFIEQGIRMLQPDGRMGLIAPSLWLLNEYGAPLRSKIHRGQHLDRWVDFKSHQIFEEAITYTALQFFTRRPNDSVRFFVAADGAVATNWRNAGWQVSYNELSPDETWVFLPEAERRLVQRLSRDCDRLDAVADIIVGIQTSADNIYHLQKHGPGHYRSFADKENPVDVQLEDAIMRPLISGPEVRRYSHPHTDTYLLFPYDVNEHGARLIGSPTMQAEFPLAWAYLTNHEDALRARDSGKINTATRWWGYVYPKNIDKQHLSKLAVPRLINRLFCAMDLSGNFALDNVDVGGVLAHNPQNSPYLAALLNSPVLNFVWRGLSKPFQNDYRSANKQFIAPLPIPRATPAQKQSLGAQALLLEQQHTALAGLNSEIDHRLSSRSGPTPAKKSEDWILPMLGPIASWKRKAPSDLAGPQKTTWAQQERGRLLENELARMQTAMIPGKALTAHFHGGQLRVLAGDTPIVDRIFVGANDGPFIAALWQRSLQHLSSSAKLDAARLVDVLRRLYHSENGELRQQVLDLQNQVNTLTAEIEVSERIMNEEVSRLYNLSESERQLIAGL